MSIGDTHLAEDVVQTVFADLARKAKALARDFVLVGWLHRHACYTASGLVRTAHRREARERKALEMNTPDATPRTKLSVIRTGIRSFTFIE